MANRQAVCVDENKPLEIQDNPIPEAPPGGLVVKTSFAGICHSDVHIWENRVLIEEGTYIKMTDVNEFDFPIVMGHEIAGEVFSIGKDQKLGAPKLSIGDKVLVYPFGGCGTCGACKLDRSTLCPENHKYSIGLSVNGGYGSYVPVPDSAFAVKAPDGLPLDVGALVCCSGLTAYTAVSHIQPFLKTAYNIYGSSTLLIVGAGGLGLWALVLSKVILRDTKTKVVVADVGEAKLETAREAGADATVLWDPKGNNSDYVIGLCDIDRKLRQVAEEDIIKKTMEACGGGLDASIDFVGSTVTTGRTGKCSKKGAMNVLIGLYGGVLSVPLVKFPTMSLSYRGMMPGSVQQLRELVQLVAKEKIKPPPITRVPLEEATNVLAKLKMGTYKGRGVIDYSL